MKSSKRLAVCLAILALVAAGGVFAYILNEKSDSQLVASPLTTSRSSKLETERARLLDPRQDGWHTEALSDKATELLKIIAKQLAKEDKLKPAKLASFVAQDFVCGPLAPKESKIAFQGEQVTVRRPAAGNATDAPNSQHHGVDGLADALRSWAASLGGSSAPSMQVKVFSIDVSSNTATTRAYVQASANTDTGFIQHDATWKCHWMLSANDDGDLHVATLNKIEVERFEESILDRGSPGPMFADFTEFGVGDVPSFREQLQLGNGYWNQRLDLSLGIGIREFRGFAVGDVNGDHLDDIYVCEPGGLPNLLYVQREDGRFEDVSRDAHVDYLDQSSCALFADLDNDGDQDLVLSSMTAIAILSNDGKGAFAPRALLPGGRAFQPTAIDYDNDGDLDFYIGMYEMFGDEEGAVAGIPIAVPYHDANNGKPNIFYRNDGNWRFTDVTKEVGLDQNNHKFTLAAAWVDYDQDGDQDLYVTNDFGRNNLYQFDSSTKKFQDVAAHAGVEDMSTGMSASFGDYNRDGWPDLYISNMWSSAGNRITYQRQFRDTTGSDVKHHYQYLARGNSLFENSQDGRFRDVSQEAGVLMGRWAWGSLFTDLNNDGWEDLVVANGYITGARTTDL